MTIDDLRKYIREAVREEALDLSDRSYVEDLLAELADQVVPVYNRELLEVLASDHSLGVLDEDMTTDNVWALLHEAIYMDLYSTALAELQDILDEEADE